MADMTKYLRAPEVRAKIAAIMPDDAARAAWEQRLAYEVESSALAGRSLGNSATYRRGAERQDADNIVIDLVSDVFKGNTNTATLFDFIFNQARRLGRSARDTLRSRTDQIEADILMRPQSSPALDQLLNQLGTASRGPNPLRNSAVTNAANAVSQ
jgi:hypothetical protein